MLELIQNIIHIDKYLSVIIPQLGSLIYTLFFSIIFIETGLVIFPFLPGDSLLFAAGAFAAKGMLNVLLLFIILSLAAILGDSLNYFLGKRFGRKLFKKNSRWFNENHLIKTEKFYDKHGNKTIILARFIPIIRTFAPFVAGIGKMNYLRFITYNIVGGISWVALFLFGGYLFGNIPFVANNFSIFILAIIIISVLPAIIEYLKSRKN